MAASSRPSSRKKPLGRSKKPRGVHVHVGACLGAWSECPGISHTEWIQIAGIYHDQDAVWRAHELHGRRNLRDAADYCDLGGES
jgi:hypothetical protein